MSEEGQFHLTLGELLKLVIRYILCLIAPPLAVIDQGCGSILLVFILTLCGWLPGTICAFIIVLEKKNFFLKK
jgi:uncharacterized membrane protein YqaE (UPF0057 family)